MAIARFISAMLLLAAAISHLNLALANEVDPRVVLAERLTAAGVRGNGIYIAPTDMTITRIDGTPTFDEPIYNIVPSVGIERSYEMKNCTDRISSHSFDFTYTTMKGSSITTTNSIATSDTKSLSATFQIEMGPLLNASLTGTHSITEQITYSKAETVNRSESVSITQRYTINATPKKSTLATLSSIQYQIRVPWRIEGIVEAALRQGSHQVAYNPLAFIQWVPFASTVLDAGKRTLVSTGYVDVFIATDGKFAQYERELSPGECNSPHDIVVSQGGRDFRDAFLSSGSISKKVSPDLLKLLKSTPSFFGKGTHQCQSRTSIGHKCESSGFAYVDCIAAFNALKADDCCPRTPDEGVSIDFMMNYCLPM
jgi:hypothetical protein